MKKRSQKRPRSRKSPSPSRRPAGACAAPFEEQKCHNFFELTSDMIMVFKAEGALVEVNPAWFQALEYSAKDLSHLTVWNMLHPKDKKEAEGVFLAVLKDGISRRLRATFVSKDGTEVDVDGTVSRPSGRSHALSGIFHDVTRVMRFEELKDEFISTVSHELRTPLTIVREGVAQVRDELLGPVPDNQKAFLNMVLQNSDRLGQIIEELLDVSKLEAGKVRLHRKLCDIVALAREVAGNFESIVKKKNLQLLTEFSPEKIEIYVESGKIIQVLTNLINNALKFTDRGHIKVQIRATDGFVECKVSDTGRGISKEDLPDAFQKFRQFGREAGPGARGTGLGLSICKKLIELHHGHVKIESVPTEGTTVTFTLPQYTHRDLFKDAISQAMSRCAEDQSPLSVIIFDILDFEVLEKRLGAKSVEQLVVKVERIINDSLRRVADVAIKDTKAIMVLLPDTKKENAYLVVGRLSQILEDFLRREQKKLKVQIHSSVVCFPEEAKSLQEILDGIYA